MNNRRGMAIMEYAVLVIVLLTAMLGFRFYIQRGYTGQMVKAGETFAFGRYYDPRNTLVCTFDDKLSVWYAEPCYESSIDAGLCETAETVTDGDCPYWNDAYSIRETYRSQCAHTACLYDQKLACKPACAYMDASGFVPTFPPCPTDCGSPGVTLSPTACTSQGGTAVDLSNCAGMATTCPAIASCPDCSATPGACNVGTPSGDNMVVCGAARTWTCTNGGADIACTTSVLSCPAGQECSSGVCSTCTYIPAYSSACPTACGQPASTILPSSCTCQQTGAVADVSYCAPLTCDATASCSQTWTGTGCGTCPFGYSTYTWGTYDIYICNLNGNYGSFYLQTVGWYRSYSNQAPETGLLQGPVCYWSYLGDMSWKMVTTPPAQSCTIFGGTYCSNW